MTAITWSTDQDGTLQDRVCQAHDSNARQITDARRQSMTELPAINRPIVSHKDVSFLKVTVRYLRNVPSYPRGFRRTPPSRHPDNESDAPFPEPSVPEPCLGAA